MEINYHIFIVSITYFLLAWIITYLTIPIINKIALRNGLIDKPSQRKQHKYKVARIGGIAFYIGFIITIIGLSNIRYFNYLNTDNNQIFLIIIGSLGMLLLGAADDLKELSPWSRLFVQFGISTFLWSNGFSINEINLSTIGINSFLINLNPILSYFFTVLWLVGIINAFNWIDGLDGLAAGIAVITAISYLFIFSKIMIIELIILSSIICGICIAFLKHNFFPAKIFMGDGGAYFLGFVLGSIAIYDFDTKLNNPIFLSALIILFLPILDMFCVISKRLLQGRSPFFPDKSHFHHYLLNIGFNHKQTVLILLSTSIIFAIIGCSLINFELITF